MIKFSRSRTSLLLILFLFLFSGLSAQINFSSHSAYKYLKGIDAVTLPDNWYDAGFDDAAWPSGNAPFRYGDGSGGTELTDMQGSYSTVFLRSTFSVQNLDKLGDIRVAVNWDDGFVLWINGTQVLSRNAPAIIAYDALATELHESGTPETFLFSGEELNLVEGENSIAVVALNITLDGSSDFYYDMSISAQAELPEFIDTLGVSFSHNSGFYDETFLLSLESPLEGVDIMYTLDGSNPQNSTTSLLYDSIAKILIDPSSDQHRTLTPAVVVRASTVQAGYNPAKPSARTYVFLENVKTQVHPGGSWPAYNMSNNSYQYFYYDMHPDVVFSTEYGSQIEEALLDIPSISIVTDNFNLFDPGYGIYVNAEGHGYEWERESSIELFYPDGTPGFNVNAGLRIRGGWSRHNNYPKRAFRLFFREEYGTAKLNYPLFEDEGVSEFDKVDLRTAQNYSWANGASKYNTFVREVFARDAQKDAGQPYTRSRYYHLYLNGMYWGLYQTQERSEARFAESYFGGNKEDYDVIKVNGVNYQRNVISTDGNMDKWKEIFDYTQAGFEENEDYFRMESRDAEGNPLPGGEIYVEIDNLIDYMMNIFFTGNYDSPTGGWSNNKHANNMWAIGDRERKSVGFKFFIHDAEHSLMNEASAGPGIGLYENRADIGDRSGSYRMSVSHIDNFHPQWLHYKLSKNAEYRVRFANRAWHQLNGDGIFTEEKNNERFNKRVEQIDKAIIAESARWGGARISNPMTRANWLSELNEVRNEYFPYRTDIVIGQLEDLDLFPSVAAPRIVNTEGEEYGLKVEVTASEFITFRNPESGGTIYYTMNGEDPRIIGGDVNEDAIRITSGGSREIDASMVVKARILRNNKWSALSEATFIKEQNDYSHLQVTEVHYHPRITIVGSDTLYDDFYEFIEFRNTSTSEGINLSGLVIDSAIYYVFPKDHILPPQQYFVVASKPRYFFERYGMHPSGNFQRNLSNAGERVILRKFTGEVLLDFTYDDDLPWPEYADGTGASLISVSENPDGDPNEYAYWQSSSNLHGSPFTHDIRTIVEKPEEYLARNIQVYPNPTADLLMIQDYSDDYESSRLRIFDIRGALYLDREFNGYLEVSLAGLNVQKGIYLVEVSSPAGRETRKVIYK